LDCGTVGDMSRVTGVGILLIQVSNIERSVRFWRDGLGIPFRDQGAADGCFECRLGGTQVLLHPDFGDDLRGIKRGAGVAVHLSVDDADAYHAELVSRGVKPSHAPEDKPWGREFSVHDPDGYEIEIVGPRRG
jgi:catechol 2,3-dioxygenase-like lactoylglutathione lyase family enzyme